MGDQIACPVCGYTGPEIEFEVSQSGECLCPSGCKWPLVEGGDDCEPDDEPCGSCENCGCNLYAEDDFYLCDQCQWSIEQSNSND